MAKNHKKKIQEQSEIKSEEAKFHSDLKNQGIEAVEVSPDFESSEKVAVDGHEQNDAKVVTAPTSAGTGESRLQRVKRWALSHKKIVIPTAVVLLLGLLAAVPFTRYAVAGIFLKKQYEVRVLDTETSKPVSSAVVTLGGARAETDGEGKARITAPVGSAKLMIQKKYYETTTQNVTVPIGRQKQITDVKVKAIGRPVVVKVLNKISKQPVENAAIVALDTAGKTDKDGNADIVLPADKSEAEATISIEGYNEVKQIIVAAGDEVRNTVQLTPAGKVYFLSNQSGKIDVVKSNLDGTGRSTVMAGTGKEDKFGTILLSSRDWKYLALLSKRDGGEYAKLFLIETGTDKVTVMDEGTAEFRLVGWSGQRFVYTVSRQKVDEWQPNQQALKSYDAAAKKITTLEQTAAEGNEQEYYRTYIGENIYILGDQIVYAKSWNGNSDYAYYTSQYANWHKALREKKAELRSVRADGGNNRLLKDYAARPDRAAGYIDLKAYEFGEIWIKPAEDITDEYENGQVKNIKNVTYNEFWAHEYPTRLVSPSGEKTFWSEARDGKFTLFVGDQNAANEQQIAARVEYSGYGWFSDQYVLATKNGSELYIMPAVGGEALKLTDYYRPNVEFEGYGYGYGGL